MSYLGHSFWLGLTPLRKYSRCILQSQPTGHSFGGSYSSAGIQSMYTTPPDDWALMGEFYSTAEMQSMYSTAPDDLAVITRLRVFSVILFICYIENLCVQHYLINFYVISGVWIISIISRNWVINIISSLYLLY